MFQFTDSFQVLMYIKYGGGEVLLAILSSVEWQSMLCDAYAKFQMSFKMRSKNAVTVN